MGHCLVHVTHPNLRIHDFIGRENYTIRAYLEICFISYCILETLLFYSIDSDLIIFPHLLKASLCSGVLTRHHLTNALLTDI